MLLALGLLVSGSSFAALTPNYRPAQNNDFIFIENLIDREYFITPRRLDPRFSGSNVWTKFASRQTSLGYMGYVGWTANNLNIDMWLDNALINNPFQGLRCVQGEGVEDSVHHKDSLVHRIWTNMVFIKLEPEQAFIMEAMDLHLFHRVPMSLYAKQLLDLQRPWA